MDGPGPKCDHPCVSVIWPGQDQNAREASKETVCEEGNPILKWKQGASFGQIYFIFCHAHNVRYVQKGRQGPGGCIFSHVWHNLLQPDLRLAPILSPMI
eukprot:186293-Pelagomonas_calceolata.AAC.2